jgi:O-acetyl-ADP-ribose deacetylase (regulator of RNase III)
MFDIVAATNRPSITGTATRFLDHEMRLRHIFKGAGLSQQTVEYHLKTLHDQRIKISSGSLKATAEHEEVLSALHTGGRVRCRVLYGDITRRALLASREFGAGRRAVVSPEDTYISAGGGVAYALLKKAGELIILNELAKLSPIKQRSVAITSGGYLPVQYILHAAALQIEDGPDGRPVYVASQADVRATAEEVFTKAAALGVRIVWLPLIGAGVASLSPNESLRGLLEAVRTESERTAIVGNDLEIAIVILKERLLPRHLVAAAAADVLGPAFVIEEI